LLLLCLGACADSPTALTPNQAPNAYAGENRTEYDVDWDGTAQVWLDGSRSSDRDGSISAYVWLGGADTLAVRARAEVTLALGLHGITLEVTDDRGARASDLVWIAVESAPAPNSPPTVTILSPSDGEVFEDSESVILRGEAYDPEEGRLDGNRLLWSIDGANLGRGSEVYANTGPGTHKISLRATDFEGATGSATITITIWADYSFANDILPFFSDHCVQCHGAERSEGGIRLDGYEAIVTGGNQHGPLVVAGDPTQGILIPKLLAEHHDAVWNADVFFAQGPLHFWILAGLPE